MFRAVVALVLLLLPGSLFGQVIQRPSTLQRPPFRTIPPLLGRPVQPPRSTLYNALVGAWSLNETSGNRAASYGGYTLTDSGSVGYVAGKDGNAANFTTTNYLYTSVSFSPVLGQTTEGVTWAFWTRRTSNPASLASPLASSATSNPPWQFRFDSSGRMTPFIRDSSTTVINLAGSGTTLCDDAWHLIIIIWNQGHDKKLWLYVPERSLASSSTAGSYELLYNFSAGMRVGRDGGDTYLYAVGSPATAAVDAVVIWDRALASTERDMVYNGGAGMFYPY